MIVRAEPSGKGVLTFVHHDGLDRYEGMLEAGKMNGEGWLLSADGCRAEGTWMARCADLEVCSFRMVISARVALVAGQNRIDIETSVYLTSSGTELNSGRWRESSLGV